MGMVVMVDMVGTVGTPTVAAATLATVDMVATEDSGKRATPGLFHMCTGQVDANSSKQSTALCLSPPLGREKPHPEPLPTRLMINVLFL